MPGARTPSSRHPVVDEMAEADIAPRDREPLSGLVLDRVTDLPASAIGLARPGQPPLDSCAMTIHFGGRAKA